MHRWIFSFILWGSLWLPHHAVGSPACSSQFSVNWIERIQADPQAALLGLLRVNGPIESRGDARTQRKIQRLQLDREVSAEDVRRLVIELFEAKYGESIKFRNLFKDAKEVFEARVTRLVEEEIATRGLWTFYQERGLLRDQSQIGTVWWRVKRSSVFQILLSATSLLSIQGSVPTPQLPRLSLFKINERQMDTLLIHGLNSSRGQEILRELFPSGQRDTNYAIFARVFNRVAFVTGIVILTYLTHQESEAEAERNGEIFLNSLNERIDGIAQQTKGPADTKDDLLFDIVVGKLKTANGGIDLTMEDLIIVCKQIPAPNRCAS